MKTFPNLPSRRRQGKRLPGPGRCGIEIGDTSYPPEQPDTVERRMEKAARWYGEYMPDRGWPPEDRPV